MGRMDFWRIFGLFLMTKLKRYKLHLLLVAAVVVAIVALIKPEYAEDVARAFMLLIGVAL